MLNRLALRLATVRALRGRTLAGPHVLDSEQQAIEEIAEEKPRPVIVVYTDNLMTSHAGRNLWHTGGNDRVGSGFQKLIIEIAMTQRMTLVDEETGAEITSPGRPLTDPMLAAALDIIERQVIAALMADTPWAEVWRRFADKIGDRVSDLGTAMREGVRLAGRQITLDVALTIDPPPGEPLDTRWKHWNAFLALARTDADLAPVVALIEAELAGGPASEWDQVRGTFGLTRGEAAALDFQPPMGTP